MLAYNILLLLTLVYFHSIAGHRHQGLIASLDIGIKSEDINLSQESGE